jgi:predicted transcriptional regulator of viral defense system
MKNKSVTAKEKAKQIIRKYNGVIRTADVIKAGIHPRNLYALCNEGSLERISRGVFRLSALPPISNPDLVTVFSRVPRAVVCLISALSFHRITTQIPHQISIALEKGAETPRISYPPISVHRFQTAAFKAGIENHKIDTINIRVYSPEKTLADCFKFRHKVGMDVVIEALRLYKTRKPFKVDDILKYARICRVKKIMMPYLEAII